jgi:NADPH:quinone reductase-like Zn-dependent oxidoreductase
MDSIAPLPSTTQCLELAGFDFGNLRLAERTVPTPGADEVLLRVHAASLNYRDYLVINGR